MTGDKCVQNWYLWGVKKIQATPTKQDLSTSYRVLDCKVNSQIIHFYYFS